MEYEISAIPDPFRVSMETTKMEQPQSLEYFIKNLKNMPFYKKDYYHADL